MDNSSAGDVCLLVPGTVGMPDAAALSTTGVDISVMVVVAGLAVAVGVVLLTLVLLRRRRSARSAASRRSGAAVIIAALLLAGGLSQSAHETASAATGVNSCDLMAWNLTSVDSGSAAQVSGTPSEILSLELTNVAAFPIEVTFATAVTRDDDALAPWVDVEGTCAECAVPTVYADVLTSTAPGIPTHLSAGQTIRVSFSGTVREGNPAETQDAEAFYNLIASARQVA